MSEQHFNPSDNDFEFRHFPFYWVTRLSNSYTIKMEGALKKAEMNVTSWRVCLILRENGTISMSDIATHAVARLPTITKAVYKLKERGLVEIAQNPNDARVTMVSITATGLEKVSSVLDMTSRIFNQAFEGLSENDIAIINAYLRKLFTNISL